MPGYIPEPYLVMENPAGISDIKTPPEIKVIQIPHSTMIRIETGRDDRPYIHLDLFDMIGKSRYQTDTREGSFEIDPGSLPSGTYLLELLIDGQKQVEKIVVSRQ